MPRCRRYHPVKGLAGRDPATSRLHIRHSTLLNDDPLGNRMVSATRTSGERTTGEQPGGDHENEQPVMVPG